MLPVTQHSGCDSVQHIPQMSTIQRLRLRQWVLQASSHSRYTPLPCAAAIKNNFAALQAVSSGTYSLSALLLAGVLSPALAVGEFNPGSAASVTASQPPSIPNPTQGLTNFEGLLIFAPVILYGLFSIYRSKVDQRAKVSCRARVVCVCCVLYCEAFIATNHAPV